MIIPIELRFKADKDSKSAFRTDKTIKSHDVNSVEFHITIEGLELTDNHTANILSLFHSSKSQVNTDCEIVDGKIIYKPNTNLISRRERVTNYVYVYNNNQSLDVREFTYTVDLSKIDETALKVKEMYDQSYADLLADFEQALSDYKDSLPQASDLRAEIDVILNQFGVDSQAKLNQYDTDAQQVIADNQKQFDLAESDRQNTYEQAEDIRNQTTNQAVLDWKQGADGLVDSKLSEIQTDASTLINGAIDDFNKRGDAEIAEWRGNADSELEEYLADRVVLKNMFPTKSLTTEVYYTRTNIYLDFEIGSKYYTSRDLLVVKGVANEATGRITDLSGIHFIFDGSENSKVITYLPTSGDGKNRSVYVYGANSPDEFGEREVLFDNLTLIDLTATFGAGNEPTKAEMDELIKITGYFDEITLTQKQMLNWQLNLMRQNRNALIALGGTII